MSVLPVGAPYGASFAPLEVGDLGATSTPSTPTSPTAPSGGAAGLAGGAGGVAGAGGSGSGFAAVLGNAIDGVQAAQANADNLATQAATGSLTNVADYMVAAEDANIQTQLTAAVRNNALQAFQQIMGMQL